ncbi:MAG TPA: AAA family ATPase [Pyrinomonadaceae bacterium]|jgi:predicted kinase|nr:AAA family ATPase [Pyrinomonadaceae bacterium]
MNLVFIYGPPGVGKLSVARELARATGYRLFDNHVSIRCAESVFDFGTKPFGKVVGGIRALVIEEAARAGVSLVFTFVYARPEDTPFVERVCGLVESQGGRALLVRLSCEREELERRLPHADRARVGKMASLDTLREVAARYDIFSPVPGRAGLEVDNTNLAPDEVARLIVDHYHLPPA